MNPVDALPLSLEQKVDQICTHFEAAWKTGVQPSIEDYLADSSAAEKSEIVRELILLDVFYRRQRGDVCVPADYQARFPDIEPTWLAQVLNHGTAAARVTVDEPGPVERPGGRVGPYKLLQQIGEGGMGVVFMADQTEPVRRRVALKLIKPGLDTRQVGARFEAERQALALMDHPNIAKVLEAGTTDSGRPYFVMELVRGVPITKYCDDHHLTPQQRLALFVPVCHAVQHAHQKGIIHRDLKPSNVLIALYDGEPVPKVIDFGVAKAVGGGLTDKTLFTDFGAVVGTLEYMSPEQAEPNQLDIDTRADLYALGVLLYELLTGSTPFERKRLRAAALLECLRIIREEEPQKPSTRLSTADQMPSVAANRGLEPKKLTGLVRGDLDWIVMKCLEKDRNRRYETANGLAMDLQRYLADEPVLASPPSAAHRLRKFSRRHKTGLWTTAAALLVVLLAAGGIGWSVSDRMARETVRRRELARRELDTEQAVTVALAKAEQSATRAKLLPCTTSVEAKATLAEWRDAITALAEAEAALTTGEGVDQLRERVVERRHQIETGRMQSQRKEQLFRDLDEARMARSTFKDSKFDFAGAAAKFAAVFATFGFEVQPGQTEDLARRIRVEEPAVREALLVGLDNWISCLSPPMDADLRALAQAADEDQWRREVRRAGVERDGPALVRLSGEARRLTLPPTSVELLAIALNKNDQRQEERDLLRWARGRHPTDFWIAVQLGSSLSQGATSNPVDREEQIGCFRVAVALRPDASAAHGNLGVVLAAKNQMDDAIAEFKRAIALDSKVALFHYNLGSGLRTKKQLDDAIVEFNKAIVLDPKDALPHFYLGIILAGREQFDDADAEFKRAIALDPKHASAHHNLGELLADNNRIDDAVAEFKRAIALDPKLAQPHSGLGNILRSRNELDDAIVEFNKAIELDPKFALAYNRRGIVLADKNQWDDAIADYNKAIALDPKSAGFHYNLGRALRGKKQFDDAIVEFNKAITLDPKDALAYNNRGLALLDNKQFDDAIADYHKAITLDPKYAGFHYNLGLALRGNKQLNDAIVEFNKAIALDPKFALAHNNLGLALAAKNLPDAAIVEFNKAILLDPKSALVHGSLAEALLQLGRVAEAKKSIQRAIDLLPEKGPLLSSLLRVRDKCDVFLASEPKLPDVLAGKAQPKDNRERLIFIEICRYQKGYAAGAKLSAEAFTADAKLADDPQAGHRYNAACFAVLAAARQDKDILDDKERSRLLHQALEWLRADLALWTKRANSDKRGNRALVHSTLKEWQEDTDLTSVRDPKALERLPQAESDAWHAVWKDVDALAGKTQEKK